MTFPVRELAELLSPKSQVIGMVVGSVDGVLRVATKNGITMATPVGTISTGERVVVSGGIATKAPTPSVSFSV